MNLKTLDKHDAVHLLNILSMVMAWGVTCYFFEAIVPNHAIAVIGNVLMSPVYFTDILLNSFSNYSILGNFNLMFFVLWLSYAAPITVCYPYFMVRNHDVAELKEWYLSRTSGNNWNSVENSVVIQ